jgi:tetratricopeptide (TPR) repeat protein
METLARHALLIGCLYGVVAWLLFYFLPDLKHSTFVQIAYSFGVFLALLNLARGFSLLGGDALSVFSSVILLVFQGIVVLLFNAMPLHAAFNTFVTNFMRAASSDDNLRFRRSYDRAEGAEARGELELAERLYREYLEEDPSDPVGHRKLAELLLNMGRREAAIDEFEAALRVADEPEQEQRTLWRLGEVHEEDGELETACDFYDKLMRRYPGSHVARYARERLEKLSTQPPETP